MAKPQLGRLYGGFSRRIAETGYCDKPRYSSSDYTAGSAVV